MEIVQVAPWAARPPRIFNGKLTIINKSSKEHRTFQIKTQKKDAKFAPGKRIVSLLNGPNNQEDYIGFGFVDDNGIQVWANKRTKAFLGYAALINAWMGIDNSMRKNLKLYDFEQSKKCLICNRELTTPESLKSGIGPVCAEGY